jgi:hypothetical protein
LGEKKGVLSGVLVTSATIRRATRERKKKEKKEKRFFDRRWKLRMPMYNTPSGWVPPSTQATCTCSNTSVKLEKKMVFLVSRASGDSGLEIFKR